MNRSPHRHFTCIVAGLLLGLALLAGPAGAAPKDWALFSSPWSLLSRLWAEIALIADPNGWTVPSHVTGNIGLEMDPNGRPAANPGSQNIGLEMEPDGAPHH